MFENRKINYYAPSSYKKDNDVQYIFNYINKDLINDIYVKPISNNRSQYNINSNNSELKTKNTKNKYQKISKKSRSSSNFMKNNNLRSYATKYNNHIYSSK